MVRRNAGTTSHVVTPRNSVSKAAKSGDALTALTALRDVLAAAIDECGSKRDLAALLRQFTAVLAQIEAARVRPPQRRIADEIAARRTARQGAAAADAKSADR